MAVGGRARQLQGSVVLLVLVVASGGVVLGWSLTPAPVPDTMPEPVQPETVVAEAGTFDDARSVELTPVFAAETSLGAPRPGVVTSSDCEPGETVESGTTLMGVDGRPLLALATEVPLWRDISGATRGEDVRGLQVELARLGFDVEPSDSLSREAAEALRELLDRTDPTTNSVVLGVDDVVWLPAGAIEVSECVARLGDRLEVGEPLFAFGGGIESVSVSSMPSGLVAGERRISVGDVVVEADDRGIVTDPTGLDELARSEPFELWAAAEGAVALTGQFVLAEAVEVVVLPPAAVIGDSGVTCVRRGDGEIVRVSVLATRAGASLVQPEAQLHEVTTHPAERSC